MQVRCPSCGAQFSLDSVIDDSAASQALQGALELSPIGPLVIRYIAMFRPEKSKLTWPRVAALLNELLPIIRAERLQRDGKMYEAPMRVWASAIEKAIAARDNGSLRTPLKGHGYLFEIVVAEVARGQAAGAVAVIDNLQAQETRPLSGSGTAQAVAALESRKRRS